MTDIPRSELVRRLSALPPAGVNNLADEFCRAYTVEDLILPQSGLALLKLRDGALHETYYLGEIPVTRAHVAIRTDEGQIAEGAALMLDDRVKLARNCAVLDAVYGARLPGWEEVRALLLEGGEAVRKEARQRRALLAATRVDFSLLSGSLEDDNEE